jgi:hypothetical protein
MIIEEEFVSLYGRTVKLHLKQSDGSFKNHYHHYKTEEKAKKMYLVFLASIGG